MRRREFIAGLGSAATPWTLGALAQPVNVPVVGFLRSTSLVQSSQLVVAFRNGLREAGFVEGQNVAIEFRSADDHPDRLPALVGDLIRLPVAVIVGNSASAIAAKAETSTVPIVFATGGDPVMDGLVTSLSRPDGNVTGVNFFAGALASKRLAILRQIVPKATTIGMLATPNLSNTERERSEVLAAARAIGQQITVLDVNGAGDIEPAFAALVRGGIGALIVGTGAFANAHRERFVALAAHYAIPTIYQTRDQALAGGLMSYGASITEAYRQVGIYVGRILKGEKPADLPVVRSTKFELVINLRTAKTLGLEVPPILLATADEVIE
jgi:ABC-type uncharacterized transport system substrate-binding protein